MGQAARVGLGLGEGVCEEASPTRRPGRKGPWVSIQTALEEEGWGRRLRGTGLGWGWTSAPCQGLPFRCCPVPATSLDPISDLGMQKAKAEAAGGPGGPGHGEAPQTPLLEHCQTFRPTPSRVQGRRGPSLPIRLLLLDLACPPGRLPAALWRPRQERPPALCSEQFRLLIN